MSSSGASAAIEARPAGRRPWSLAARRIRGRPMALVGLAFVMGAMGLAIFGGALAPHHPLDQDLARRFRSPGLAAGLAGHSLLGTDQFGRDVLSRVLVGSRASILVGFSAVLIGGLVGSALGLAAGYFGGRAADVIMRLVDVQPALPPILLALAVIALPGPSILNIILVIAVTSRVVYARVVRASVLSVRTLEFVVAGRAMGAGAGRILVQHVVPNVLAPLVIIGSFQVARVIILGASLGFLGLGVQPPTPTWGNMISDGREYIARAWWVGTFPGLAIVLAALGINLAGDGVRDALDPKTDTARY